MALPINPPSRIELGHLMPAVSDGRLTDVSQACVLAVITRLAAKTSRGWVASMPVDEIVKTRYEEILHTHHRSTLPSRIMQAVENLATPRGIITVNNGMVSFTEKGIDFVESCLSEDLRFPCAPRPFSRPRELLESRQLDLCSFEIKAIQRLVEHCVKAGTWNGVRHADLTDGDRQAFEIGLAYGRLEARAFVRITVECPCCVIHATPALAALIYRE